jgi:hypothetical protein
MIETHLYDFLSGAVACSFAVCALLFLRFWRRSQDSLFLAFSLAFALLGIGQAAMSLANIPTEESSWLFLIRLSAFALIIFAIARKNRAKASE